MLCRTKKHWRESQCSADLRTHSIICSRYFGPYSWCPVALHATTHNKLSTFHFAYSKATAICRLDLDPRTVNKLEVPKHWPKSGKITHLALSTKGLARKETTLTFQCLCKWHIIIYIINVHCIVHWWLGSRVVSVLDSGAEGPGSNRSRDAVG